MATGGGSNRGEYSNVYLFYGEDRKLIKIGESREPQNRLSAQDVKDQDMAHCYDYVRVKDGLAAEKAAQRAVMTTHRMLREGKDYFYQTGADAERKMSDTTLENIWSTMLIAIDEYVVVFMCVSDDRRQIKIGVSHDPRSNVGNMRYVAQYTQYAIDGNTAKAAAKRALVEDHDMMRVGRTNDCYERRDSTRSMQTGTLDDLWDTVKQAVKKDNEKKN